MYRISKSVGLGFEGMENETFSMVYRDGVAYAHRYNNEPWVFERHGDNVMCLTRSKAWHIANRLFPNGCYYWELLEWVEMGCSITPEEERDGVCYLIDMSTRTVIGRGWV